MAVATSSSRTGLVKAVVLPWVLVLLAVAAAGTEDGAAVAKSGGRFPETPGGRKLLHSSIICGPGSAPDYNCKNIVLGAKNATCCTDPNGNQACVEVGGVDVTNCGSCFNKCKLGDICCSGVCVDPTAVDNTSLADGGQ